MANEEEKQIDEEEEDLNDLDLDADLEELDKEMDEAIDIDESDIEEIEKSESGEEEEDIDDDLDEETDEYFEGGNYDNEEEKDIDNDLDEEESDDEEGLSEEESKEQTIKNILEGILFVAGRPVSMEELNAKTGIGKREIEPLMEDLMMDYLMRPSALEIIQIQDKYSLQIKAEYMDNVKKFATTGLIPDKYLKTLTIVALKQPMMKSQLIKLRGSGAYDHIKFLIENGFIKAQKKGRSSELYTTDQFSDTFGLSRDLKTMKKQLIEQLGMKEEK